MSTLLGLILLFLAMTLLVLAMLGIVLWRRRVRGRRAAASAGRKEGAMK